MSKTEKVSFLPKADGFTQNGYSELKKFDEGLKYKTLTELCKIVLNKKAYLSDAKQAILSTWITFRSEEAEELDYDLDYKEGEDDDFEEEEDEDLDDFFDCPQKQDKVVFDEKNLENIENILNYDDDDDF